MINKRIARDTDDNKIVFLKKKTYMKQVTLHKDTKFTNTIINEFVL